MIKHFCDRCGRVITDTDSSYEVSILARTEVSILARTNRQTPHDIDKTCEFCFECVDELRAFLRPQPQTKERDNVVR